MSDQKPQDTLFKMYEEWGEEHDYRVADSVRRFKMYLKHMARKVQNQREKS